MLSAGNQTAPINLHIWNMKLISERKMRIYGSTHLALKTVNLFLKMQNSSNTTLQEALKTTRAFPEMAKYLHIVRAPQKGALQHMAILNITGILTFSIPFWRMMNGPSHRTLEAT